MTEDVFDPTKGVHVPGIFTGNLYVYKMQQTAESKTKGRSTDNYSQEDIPEGKHFGDMEWAALLGSHATETIKDLKLIKGRRNDDFWRQTKLGETPTMPGTPIVYDKFKSMLQASGINIVEDRNRSHIFAMTNKQAEALTQGNKLENADTFSATNFKPLPGGLFDPDKTSSLSDGKKWAYYELPEPLPNPIMEEPLRALLGVTRKDFAGIVAGDIPLQGKTGGVAIKDYLSRLSLTDVIAKAEDQIRTGSASKRDAAIKLATYAKAMQKEGVRPEDFMMTRVPVLPPAWRPITAMGSMTMVADPNYMYKALVDTMQDYKESKDLPKELQNKARSEMYQAYKALIGTQDPNQEKLQEKHIGGMLDQILGKGSPKASMWQRRVLGANIDLYGLSAISLNPALKLNQVGIPETQAWEIYSPFLVKELVRQGNDATSAVRDIKNHSENAYRVLQKVMSERPVIINRAPTLHKYSIGAAWPILVKGNTLQVPPSRNKAFNYDMDGNCCDFDSVISLRIAKSAMDKFGSAAKVPVKSGAEYVGFSMKIGEFPRYGAPMKDKNGADVYTLPEGIQISSFDITTGQHVWKEASHFTVEQDCSCVAVEIGNHSMVVSDNESLAVFDHSTGLLIKKAPAESLKAFVPVLKRDPLVQLKSPPIPDVLQDGAVVPLTRSEAKDIAKHALSVKDMSMYSSLKKCKKFPKLGLLTAKRLVDGNYPHAETIAKRAFGDVWWVTVDTVSDAGKREVFDFDVEGTKVFTINTGIVIWDTMSYSVPVSDKAVHEAISKLMPENGLLSIANDQPMYVPSQEYNMGGYLMSKEPAQEKSQTFKSWKDAVQAYKQGKIKVDTPVRIV